jgi:Flp pilus assembly pilin Flp
VSTPRIDNERGAVTVERLGVTVIALVVVAALVVTLTATGLGAKLSTELCRLVAAIEGNSGASCGSTSGAWRGDR